LTEISRLPSGLTVVTEMRTDVETVALGVFVNAGTRDEQPNEHGLAHFLEHMAFKGTKRRSAYQTVADIEALGGDINAETSPETTSYTVRMLADDWRAGLDVLLDIVCAPNFRDADIALEKDVVVQEIAGAMDVPDDRLVDGIGLATFDSHPIGQPILGTDSTVRSLDADALRTFRARTYAPQSVVISAAGAIKHDDLVRALEEGEPPLPSSAPANRSAPQFGAGRFFEARQTFDTHLALAWEAPAFAAPGAMPHAFAVQMLGGGMTSRLFQAIREEAGLAYAADAYQMIYSDTGLGVIQTATSADTVAPMIERLENELLRFADTMRPDELQAAKRQFRASLAMATENLPAIAARNARQVGILGDVRTRARLESEIEATTLEDVRSCWQDILQRGAFAKAAVGDAKALDLWSDWSMVSATSMV
jgi:predicted Zn-dependent peptidase